MAGEGVTQRGEHTVIWESKENRLGVIPFGRWWSELSKGFFAACYVLLDTTQ